MSGRIIAVGDIHGCHVALEVLLRMLKLTEEDTLVVLGDVVDRGPGSKQAIDQLLEFQEKLELIFIQGNHEEMMLNGLEGGSMRSMWLYYGGRETVDSYGGQIEDVCQRHIDFLKDGLDYWETETEIFIHANLKPGVPLASQNHHWLRWQHLTGMEFPHESGKRIICGHTSQKGGFPLIMKAERWVCIDTFAHGEGFLTGLDVTNDLVYQTSQTGEYRGCRELDSFPDWDLN